MKNGGSFAENTLSLPSSPELRTGLLGKKHVRDPERRRSVLQYAPRYEHRLITSRDECGPGMGKSSYDLNRPCADIYR